MTKPTVIKFKAEIVSVSTRQDYAVRVVLDLPENQAEALRSLIESYQKGAFLEIAALPVKAEIGN